MSGLTGIFDDRYFLREMAGHSYIIKGGQGFDRYMAPVVLSETAVLFLYILSSSYRSGHFFREKTDILNDICAAFDNEPTCDMIDEDLLQLFDTLVRWDADFSDIARALT